MYLNKFYHFRPLSGLLFVLGLALFQFAAAQTSINGGLVSGVWTKSASPYLIRGSLLIPNDSTLIIEAGVVIDFRGQYKFNVQGNIIARGTATDSIYFTTTVPQDSVPPPIPPPDDSSHWTGFDFDAPAHSNDSSIFEYCVVEFVRGSMFGNASALRINNFSKVLISNCRFSRNGDGYGGSAIYMLNGASPWVLNSTISYNRCIGITADYGSNATILNNRIVNNSGTGMRLINCGARVVNNLIANNTLQGGTTGGAVNFESNFYGAFYNNTVVNNHSAYKGGAFFFSYGGQYQPSINNCAIYGNTAVYGGNQVHIEDEGSDPNFNSCLIQGGVSAFSINGTVYTGTAQNILDVNPLFVKESSGPGREHSSSPDSANWSLQSNSPLIDQGLVNVAYPDYDLAGNPRVNICRIDIGAFEYQTGVPMRIVFQTTRENLCFGDSNGAVSAQVSGSTPPFQYIWSTGANTPDISGLRAGEYQLTVNSPSNGCSISKTYTVTQPEEILVNAGNDTFATCFSTLPLNGVKTSLDPAEWRHYSWTPSVNLNDDTLANPTLTMVQSDTFFVEVTNARGCKAKDTIFVDLKPLNAPPICIVGVDAGNKNQVVWNKPPPLGIDSFIIERETNVTGQFQRVVSQPYSAFSAISDNNSFPDVQSNLYVLKVLDKCGMRSEPSAPHKTMHLTINKGLGTTWNLIWEKYEGFTVSTYNIYRGTSSSNLTLIGNSSASNTQYTDLNAPSGDLYYQIEILSPNSCNPSKNYMTSRSNIAATKTSSAFGPDPGYPAVLVYPNPAGEFLDIRFSSFDDGGMCMFELLNLSGQTILTQELETANERILLQGVPQGMYLYRIIRNGMVVQNDKLIIGIK